MDFSYADVFIPLLIMIAFQITTFIQKLSSINPIPLDSSLPFIIIGDFEPIVFLTLSNDQFLDK